MRDRTRDRPTKSNALGSRQHRCVRTRLAPADESLQWLLRGLGAGAYREAGEVLPGVLRAGDRVVCAGAYWEHVRWRQPAV